MKLAATVKLATSVVLFTVFTASVPVGADGLLTNIVKDTLNMAGGVVQGAGNIVAGTVGAAGSVVSGTVDATGNVIDGSGRIVGHVITGTTGATTQIIGSPGVVTFGTANDVYGYTLDTRLSDLRSAILIARSNGRLSAEQSGQFQADLDRLASAEIAYRNDGVFTFDEALTSARDIDALGTRITTTLAAAPLTPLVIVNSGSPRLFVARRQVVQSSPLSSAVTGTVDAAGNIIDASGRVVGTVVRTAADITSPLRTTRTLVSQPDSAVGSRLIVGTQTEVFTMAVDSRISDLRKTIADAEASGRISAIDAQGMRADLDNIALAEANDKLSGNVFTFDETLALAKQLDIMSAKIGVVLNNNSLFAPIVVTDASGNTRLAVSTSRQMTTSTSNGVTTTTTQTSTTMPATATLVAVLDSRRMELDNWIATAQAKNQINAAEAANLSAALDAMAVRIAQLRTTNAPLTNDSALLLAKDMDVLSGRVVTTLHRSPVTPFVVADSSGTTRLVTDAFGNVISIESAKPEMFVSTFAARRANMETLISNALASRQITEAQGLEMRAELSRIATAEAAAQAGGLTYVEALPIAVAIDTLGSQARTYSNTISYVPMIQGTQFTLLGDQIIMLDDVMVRRAELEWRISREQGIGRLTSAEASRLRAQMDTLASLETRMRIDGYLTFKESRELYQGFDRVGSRLDGYVAGRRTPISSR